MTAQSVALLAFLLFCTSVAVFALLRRRKAHGEARAQDEVNRRRQEFIIAKQDEIARVMEDRSLTPDQVRAATGLLLAEILASGDAETLMPLVRDNEDWISEQLAKREPE